MKNLFLLALALVMTCTFAFAQSPYSKGKYFGKQMINCAFQQDDDAMEDLTEDLEEYADEYIESEDDLEDFLNGFEVGVREGCKANGLSDDETEQVIEIMGYAMIEAMMAELDY